MKWIWGPVVAAAVVLVGGCGSSVDPAAAEQAFTRNAGGSISSMCDASNPGWQCYYDGTAASGSYLVVKLTTDAGTDAGTLAKSAGTAWFNFIHCDYPDLKTIVVRVNGVDHNVFRSDTRADSMSC